MLSEVLFTNRIMITFINDKPQKLMKACLNVDGLSYGAFMKLLRKKDIKVNGVRTGKDIPVSIGDKIELYYTVEQIQPFTVVYVDQNVVIVNKKSGFNSDTVYETLLKTYQTAKYIHRLDRNTSGIMAFALNDRAESELLNGFKNRTFDKKYLCTVYGLVRKDEEVLTAYLVKDEKTSTVKIFDSQIKGAVAIKTGYKVLNRADETTDLEVTLYTGKTHQIRAHLAHIGHFIIGDGKYGVNEINKKFSAKTQKLHAYKLTFKFDKIDLLYYLNDKTFSTDGY